MKVALELARQWGRELGYTVSNGKDADSLVMKGSGVSPGVVVKDSMVTISCVLALEDRVADTNKLADRLLHLLMGRSAFVFLPQEAPRELAIYQRVKLSSSDIGSFNRFADGLQEVINATLLTARVLGGSKVSIPTDGMYR